MKRRFKRTALLLFIASSVCLNSHADSLENKQKPISWELDSIKTTINSQIFKCFTVPIGMRNSDNASVTVDFDIERDGTMNFIGIHESSGYGSEAERIVLEDSVRKAITNPECNPLKKLPPADKYDYWKAMRVKFLTTNEIY